MKSSSKVASKNKRKIIDDNFLLIVESPSKCAKIESYLGERYKCISSKGHIREIDGLSSINTKDRFQIEYTPIKEKLDHIETMRKTVAKYSPTNIYLSTDDDREGEAIAWHICQVCGLDVLSTKRIVFHEITQPALLAAVANPTTINLSLVAAQQARQVLDVIVGFKISPLLWRNIGSNRKNALSAGRCQTPALRLVYDNHLQYKEAIQSENAQIHKLVGLFTNSAIPFHLSCDLTSQSYLLDFLEKTKTHEHRLTIGKTRPSTRSPPKPFNTSRLLQVASNQFRLSPKRTMELCQTLYQSGLITYMRTECQKYSEIFLKKSSTYIAEQYGEEYIGNTAAIALIDTTMPHEGIRVTNLALTTMTSNDAQLSKMYGLIWRNTVESCMREAKYNMTEYAITSPLPGIPYEYTMETPVFLGWRRVEIKTTTSESSSSLAFYLEQISKSSVPVTWSLIESKVAIHTKLPSHYTEASLIQKLEDLGIGRPSTFSSIVETIQERGYVKKANIEGIKQKCTEFKLRCLGQCREVETQESDNYPLEKTEYEKSFGDERDKLVIQPTGILVLDFLLKHFDDCFSYDYTRIMEDELDLLSSQPSDKAFDNWHQICKKCLNDITERSKPLAKQTKQTFALSDTADYVLVFNSYGASLKGSGEDGKTEYLKVRADIDLDIERASRGEYTMSELVWREDNGCLGKYNDMPIYIKKGKFGLYAEWGSSKNTISLKPLNLSAEEIRLKDVVALIEKKSNTLTQEAAAELFLPQCVFGGEDDALEPILPTKQSPSDKTLLRTLRSDLSIRKGKYGPYIFHKTEKMSTPNFYTLKPFKDDWKTMSNLDLIAAIDKMYIAKVK
jgi:DNA topoisomerase-1